MNFELPRASLQKAGVEFDGQNVILYHVSTATNLTEILRTGEMRPTNQLSEEKKHKVWTNPGEIGNDDRIHLARMNKIEGIAGHMRFRLEDGGGLYVIRVSIPVNSPYLVPDQDTKEANWESSLLHSFGTCGYKRELTVNSNDIIGRFSPMPGEEEYLRIYEDEGAVQQTIDRITDQERVMLKAVGVDFDRVPLLDKVYKN